MITLEDVIERIFNLEILDEEDYEKNKRKGVRGNSKLRNASLINMYYDPEVKQTFIKDQAEQIDKIIKEKFHNKDQIKEKFLNKLDEDKKESLL